MDPTIQTEIDLQAGAVAHTHGGDDATHQRAAVVDDDDTVTAVVLLPQRWSEQDPTARWQPATGQVHPLPSKAEHVASGWSLRAGTWQEPEVQEEEPTPEPEAPVTRAEYEQLRDQLEKLLAQPRR